MTGPDLSTEGIGPVNGPGALPGGIGVTHVRVYDTVGPDGLAGGTPHLHTVCTEAYLVISGSGEVQTLSSQGFRTTPLRPGTVAWFSPGTVHRLVNHGGLELFVAMSNAGLPEAGDLVIAFDPEILVDRNAYEAAASLDPAGQRRDLAVDAFAGWRAAIETDALAALERLHGFATAIVAPRSGRWSEVVESSSGAEHRRSAEWVASVNRGDGGHLAAAAVDHQPPVELNRRLGCCGTLGVVARSI